MGEVPPNNHLQRTRPGQTGASPLNWVLETSPSMARWVRMMVLPIHASFLIAETCWRLSVRKH